MMIGDFKLRGFAIKVTATLRLPFDDLSGQTSSTNIAENGIKPKQLNVRLSIAFKNKDWLRGLMAVVEAEDAAGRRVIYDIVDLTAQALNIHQAKFTGNMLVREDETLRSWAVSFTLTEHRSVAEKKQERRSVVEEPVDTTPEALTVQDIDSTPTATNTVQAKTHELSDFEKVLEKIENTLS